MQSYAEQFREKAQARRTGGGSPGRYPDHLRELALAHLAEVRKAGGMAKQAVGDLGIDASTLRGWENDSRGRSLFGGTSGALVPVVVSDARHSIPANGSAYVIRGPHGLIIECRQASDVAALVRALA